MQHDGALRAEPVAKVRQSGELIAVPGSDVCPGFQQVLAHVIPEILEEGNLRRHEIFNNTKPTQLKTWWMHNYKSTVVYIMQFMGKISLQMSISCHLK